MANQIDRNALRILLVSPDEIMRDLVDEIVHDHGYRLYWVSHPELAGVRAQDLLPDVILVDDSFGSDALTNAVRRLLALAPGAAIVLLVGNDAMGPARQAVLAGARGFVIKPLIPSELVGTLREVRAQGRPSYQPETDDMPAKGRILVFCAPKGGTGRTTTLVNTAISIRQLTGESVTLLDADYAAPTLDVMLNLHEEHDISDLTDRMTRLDRELMDNVLATHSSGIRVLLAPHPGRLTGPIPTTHVQQVLAQLKRMSDWVIVDLGLPLDDTASAFLDSADLIVMTVLPEMVGLRNTRVMLDELQRQGYPEEKIKVVLNRATIRGGVSKREIERHLHVRVSHTVPDDQPLASFSINRGIPLAISHQRSAVARSVRKFAKTLAPTASEQQVEVSVPPHPSLFQRLFHGAQVANS